MTGFNGNLKFALCTVCFKSGHLSCQKLTRKDYHINFDEEEVHDSEEEQELSTQKSTVLEPYSVTQLK